MFMEKTHSIIFSPATIFVPFFVPIMGSHSNTRVWLMISTENNLSCSSSLESNVFHLKNVWNFSCLHRHQRLFCRMISDQSDNILNLSHHWHNFYKCGKIVFSDSMILSQTRWGTMNQIQINGEALLGRGYSAQVWTENPFWLILVMFIICNNHKAIKFHQNIDNWALRKLASKNIKNIMKYLHFLKKYFPLLNIIPWSRSQQNNPPCAMAQFLWVRICRGRGEGGVVLGWWDT